MSLDAIAVATARVLVAVVAIGLAGAAAGYFGFAVLGMRGSAAPLNVFISGPIGLLVGACVGVSAAVRKWPWPAYLTFVGIAVLGMVAFGFLINYFG